MLEERSVVLDTELTGLKIHKGHRVISVGLVELFFNSNTGFRIGEGKEWIINPDGKESHPEAQKVHGMTSEFLAKFPLFEAHEEEIRAFIGSSKIIHHCWEYGFIDHGKNIPIPTVDEYAMNTEFKKAANIVIPHEQWLNTKIWAEQVAVRGDIEDRLNAVGYPEDSRRNSLNAMLAYFGVDTSARYTLKDGKRVERVHTAIDDATVTAELYIKMAPEFLPKYGLIS